MEEKIKNLGKAIVCWITFQALCNRKELFSEKNLNQPLGEYLLQNFPSMQLKAEYNHKDLNPPLKNGRPRQLDFVLLSKTKNNLKCAFEIKWCPNEGVNLQNIVNDIFRLEMLKSKEYTNRNGYRLSYGMERFLILAGEKDIIEKLGESDLNEMLSFSSEKNEKTVIVSKNGVIDNNNKIKEYIKRAYEEYSIEYTENKFSKLSLNDKKWLSRSNDYEQDQNDEKIYYIRLPTSFKTKLISFEKTDSYKKTDSYAVAIWLISRNQNRKSLKITNI